MQEPSSMPASSMVFIRGWMPPILISSDIRYLPLGLRSASIGVSLPRRVKSSSSSSTPMVWAMASRCSTALVEPPRAMVTLIAFSNAARVMMSEGLMSCSSSCMMASPALRQSSTFSWEMASWAELLGRLMPIASIAEAMVLAVYMPPQEPGPGIAVSSICFSSISDTLPAAWPPTASKTEMILV